MRTDWQGIYLDGQTAARHAATVRLMREALEITPAGGAPRLWLYRELRQTQGFYAGEEVRIERGGDLPETLLIPDSAFLESLHEVAPGLRLRFHDPRRRRARVRWTIAAAAGVLAVTAAIYLWGIPRAGRPRRAARAGGLGGERGPVGDRLHGPAGPPLRRPAPGAALDEIVRRLTASAPPSPYTLRVYVVNRAVVNAHALPGGNVVIFKGLLERTRTPEELAGVVAHELQHVLRRHTTRAVIQDASTGLLLMALTGDVTGPLAYGLQTARTLGELRYSRRAEDEADTRGDEDAAGRPGRSGGDDRLLRHHRAGGGPAGEGADLLLHPPAGRRPDRPPQGHGRGVEGHPRAPSPGRGLGRPSPSAAEGSGTFRHFARSRLCPPPRGTVGMSADLGFQALKRSRSTFLSNLPTLVLGTASMKTTSSGSHHLATRGSRYSRSPPR